MGFLEKWFGKKKGRVRDEETLLEWLERKEIYHEYNETDSGYTVTYLDIFDEDKIQFKIIFDGKNYSLNNNISDLTEIKKTLLKRQEIDEIFENHICSPENDDLIRLYHFLKDTFSQYGIIFEMSVDEDDDLNLCYYLSEDKYGHALVKTSKQFEGFVSATSGCRLDHHEAVVEILEKMIISQPLIFAAGDITFPNGTIFSDSAKHYMFNRVLIERLNKIKNVEAKLLYNEGVHTIFIMFKNGSAFEYVAPTKQNPKGQITIIDVDEETTLEDNEEYWITKKILKLPDLLENKPDEANLPNQRFGNKKARG